MNQTRLGEKAESVPVVIGGKPGEEQFGEVEGYVDGYLVVHKRFDSDGKHDGWNLTHIGTGYRIRPFDTREVAIRAREAVMHLDWEFFDPKEMSTAVRDAPRLIVEAERRYNDERGNG